MDEGFRTAIGERISDRRKSLKLSQEDLAEKADTSKQTVSMAEHGKRELSAQTAVRLAKGSWHEHRLFADRPMYKRRRAAAEPEKSPD